MRILTGLLVFVLFVSAAGAADFELAIGHSLQKIRNDGVGLDELSREDSVRLEAAKDETESFQVVIVAGEEDLKDVEVLAAPLKGKGGEISIRWHRVEYVKTAKPVYETEYVGLWPSPLLPAGVFNVKAGEVQPLWIAVDTPAGAVAGEYEGKVVIKSGDYSKQIEVTVRVRDFQLPRPGSFAAPFGLYAGDIPKWYYGDSDYEENMPIEKFAEWCEFLGKYRLTPKNIGYEYVQRKLKGEKFGSSGANTGRKLVEEGIDPEGIEVDMSKLKHTVGKLSEKYYPPYSYGVYRLPTFQSFLENGDPKGKRDKSREDPEKVALPVKVHIEAWKRQGLPEDVYVYGIDEPREFHTQLLKDTYGKIKEAMPSVKIMQTFSYGEPDPLIGLVDIWCPITLALNENAEFYKSRVAAGDTLWMYICCWPRKPYANFFLDEPATNHRVLFWQARKYGATGLLYWTVGCWNGLDSKSNSEIAFPDKRIDAGKHMSYTKYRNNGDGLLVYPGTDERPWPSINLEIVRDGIEDYEYIALLDKLVTEAEKRDGLADSEKQMLKKWRELCEVPDSICKTMTEYTNDPQLIFERRRQIGDAIEAVAKLVAVK